MDPRWLVLASSLLGVALHGCALTSKAEPLSPRYFSPDLGVAEAGQRGTSPSGVALRLGRISAAAHLEERMAYRVSPTELGFDEERRWTEPPEAYLRRALSQELFERRGHRHVLSGAALTLDLELVGFEEVRYGQRRARVSLQLVLSDERRVLVERAIDVEQAIDGGDDSEQAPARVALALSRALARAVADVADVVGQGWGEPTEPSEERARARRP